MKLTEDSVLISEVSWFWVEELLEYLHTVRRRGVIHTHLLQFLLSSRVGVGSGQPSDNEGTQRGPHHMYVPGRAETVDWSQKPLLCPQYEHIEAGGTHEKEGVLSTYIYTCV